MNLGSAAFVSRSKRQTYALINDHSSKPAADSFLRKADKLLLDVGKAHAKTLAKGGGRRVVRKRNKLGVSSTSINRYRQLANSTWKKK